MNGLIVIVLIYAIRGLYLKYIAKTDLIPELYISPRGLISILLYFSVPAGMRLNDAADSLLLFVILATSIIMTVGLVRTKKEDTVKGEEGLEPAVVKSASEGNKETSA